MKEFMIQKVVFNILHRSHFLLEFLDLPFWYINVKTRITRIPNLISHFQVQK